MIGWIATAMALMGAVFNSQRRVEGFYLWVASNVVFLVLAACRRDWPQVVLWTMYTGISLRGIVVWTRKAMQY
jgi:nicotinamide riboside transporter PnuC